MKPNNKIFLVSAFVFCFGFLFMCVYSFLSLWSASKQRENILLTLDKNYTTDFSILLASVKNNIPLSLKELDSELLFFELPDSAPPMVWTQSDYVDIVSGVAHSIGRESINENSLVRTLHFSLPCKDISYGLQVMDIRLYKYNVISGQKSRVETAVDIFSKKELIHWSESEFSPNLNGQQTVVFGNIEVSADQALKISEENGGKEARATMADNCDIDISLAGGVLGNDWLVIYKNDVDATVFSITVDEKNGEFKIDD